MLNGILLIDKPQNFTSFDVIAKLRGMTKQKRIGHSGTLDPMATGVLVCLLGSATKLSDLFPFSDKHYTAVMQLGICTDTQDITGTVLSENSSPVSLQELQDALIHFRGELLQTPPMYSAVSIGGRRLYDLARQGLEVERPSRQINVYSLSLCSYDENTHIAVLDIHCSKGSYIRTLINDIGDFLSTGATLTGLRRTGANGFPLTACITLDDCQRLTQENRLEEFLLPVQMAFDSFERLNLDDWQAKMLKNGVSLSLSKLGDPASASYAVYHNNQFIGLGNADFETRTMKLKQF